jgi:penicillin amidase
MTSTGTDIDLARARARTHGTLHVRGLHATTTIHRDAHGIPHIQAADEHDAWFGMGFAAAQDRLWQMEYDRRRAAGRWAEAAGTSAVPADLLARRLQLAPAARADIAVMDPETRAMFAAYAAGVNAFLASGEPLPVEYAITGITPEPWQPWHSVAAQKIAQAQLLARIGPERFAMLEFGSPVGSSVILPPGGVVSRLFAQAAEEIAAAAEHLGFLAEVMAGSNSWAVHGSRTTTGKPVLCNDSHRALDVPSVYWQVHVSCPTFNVIGATFPGMPAFPHFGHNGRVAWNITHTGGDYQDLYIEQFRARERAEPGDPDEVVLEVRTPDGWTIADRTMETITVRGGTEVQAEVWRTRHGPIVHGDPRTGVALALRYTATDQPRRGFEALRPMLTARTVDELFDAQQEWVDPVNNLVAADTEGNIGYLTRGALPVRRSTAARRFPVPGWTDEHLWTGIVPFAQLPRSVNPPEGFIATANQRVIDGDTPYIAAQFAPPSRADRIVELLTAKDRYTPDEVMAMQGDVLSRPARTWAALLARSGPYEGDAERARALLAGWDGNLLPNSAQALLYAYMRREVARALFEPVVGERTWRWLTSEAVPPLGRMISQWLANVIAAVERGAAATPDGRAWDAVLPDTLAAAWRSAVAKAGPDPAAWRWGEHHGTNAQHTLAAAFPEYAAALNPARAFVGGDSDTLQCAAYGWSGRNDFDITNLSVYRQCVDLADIAHASFVIPGGASGLPGTEHYGDQLEHWRTHRRIPAHYTQQDVTAAAVETLTLARAV